MKKSVNNLYGLQLELISLLQSATVNNFVVVRKKETIQKTKIELLVYLTNSKKAAEKFIENYQKEAYKYISNIKGMPEKESYITEKQRFLKANEGLYSFLLQKKVNTEIASEGIIAETKTLESPRSIGVVRPDKKKIGTTFLGVGALIGGLIVLLRVLLFSRIATPEELKEKTKLPIIGYVPTIKDLDNKGIYIDVEPRSGAAEAFRSIRTNIQYIDSNIGSKVVLVTSNAPGEGKTFTTINLAAILSKAGKRTLILELDLHKPRVQKALEMDPDKGISSIVIGKDEIADCVKQTRIENLHAILSGPIPPNPSDMILSEKLTEIINYGRANYDYVIIDTPPAGLISDALLLMKYSDINIFVVNPKFATTAIIRSTETLVNENEIKNFAFLMNNVKVVKRRYYYGKYGYGNSGYGYGYGYGYGSGYGYGYGYRKK
jgi:capsular exopolysaccharide synthesis family protein